MTTPSSIVIDIDSSTHSVVEVVDSPERAAITPNVSGETSMITVNSSLGPQLADVQ